MGLKRQKYLDPFLKDGQGLDLSIAMLNLTFDLVKGTDFAVHPYTTNLLSSMILFSFRIKRKLHKNPIKT